MNTVLFKSAYGESVKCESDNITDLNMLLGFVNYVSVSEKSSNIFTKNSQRSMSAIKDTSNYIQNSLNVVHKIDIKR